LAAVAGDQGAAAEVRQCRNHAGHGAGVYSFRPEVASDHREGHQQAQGSTIRAASAAQQDVASRKVILRQFAAAEAVFKFAVSLASSVRLKAQAKLMRFTHYKKIGVTQLKLQPVDLIQ
jgi:hypothetical protein